MDYKPRKNLILKPKKNKIQTKKLRGEKKREKKREEKREEGRVLARRRVECKKEKKKVKQVLLAFSLFSLPRFFFFFRAKVTFLPNASLYSSNAKRKKHATRCGRETGGPSELVCLRFTRERQGSSGGPLSLFFPPARRKPRPPTLSLLSFCSPVSHPPLPIYNQPVFLPSIISAADPARAQQDDPVAAHEQKGHRPLRRLDDLLVRLVVDVDDGRRLLDVAEDHVEVLVVGLLV